MTTRPLHNKLEIRQRALANRLINYGIHTPTGVLSYTGVMTRRTPVLLMEERS